MRLAAPLAAAALLLTAPSAETAPLSGSLPGESLERLASEYAKAKARLLESPPKSRPAALEALRETLSALARIEDSSSRRVVERETRDRNADVAAAATLALIGAGDDDSLEAARRAFSRGRSWSLSSKVQVLDAFAVAGSGGLELVMDLSRGRNPELRRLALGSLAQCTADSRALEAIVEQTRGPTPGVRSAALRALHGFRDKKMVDPLIDLLGREKDERLRIEALKLLVALTGYNMGFVVEDWRKWWELAEKDFRVGQEAGDSTRVIPHDLQYFGIEVTSRRIAFLVDASNSMLGAPGGRRRAKVQGKSPESGERKIDILKKELTRILEALPADSQINIIAFARGYSSWKSELYPLAGAGRGEAIAYARGLTCAFGTNIYDTLEFALADKRVDTIYLLSDGRPVGGQYTRPEDILREIGAINRLRGATIHCISFGKETEFLREMAAQNGGEYRSTHTPPRAGKQQKQKT